MLLVHVLEERARQDREVEFDVQDDEKDSQEVEPEAYFQ